MAGKTGTTIKDSGFDGQKIHCYVESMEKLGGWKTRDLNVNKLCWVSCNGTRERCWSASRPSVDLLRGHRVSPSKIVGYSEAPMDSTVVTTHDTLMDSVATTSDTLRSQKPQESSSLRHCATPTL